jgi:hypothetical protein
VTSTSGHTPDPTVRPVKYAVSCVPEGNVNARHFTVWVEDRGRGLWAVTDGAFCYDANGDAEYEPIPSEREDEWRAKYRFDLDTALALAKRVAPTLTVNGYTVADVLAGAER